MNRRTLLAAPLALSLGHRALAAPALAQTPVRTRWKIRDSEGLDALAFLGPLTGKPFYARFYEAELAAFKPKLPAAALESIARLDKAADADDALLWPSLTLVLSGGPHATIVDLLASLDRAETVLKPPFQAGVYWDGQDWARFMAGREDLRTVLTALQAAGFPEFRRGLAEAAIANRMAELATIYAPLDVIAEQERLLGRRLEPQIDVVLLWFCKPHGTKVQGQTFLAHPAYSDASMVKTAAHEMLHPPFPMQGPTAKACYAVLEKDPLFSRILAEKDRSTGYNSLEGILNEDTVQAMDQIIQERLGFAMPPKERWTKADQGMHVLAAGLYGLLKADGYDRTGGDIEGWMLAAAKTGKLAPANLHASAAKVLERSINQLWVTPTQA
jgi:hypothetical protein